MLSEHPGHKPLNAQLTFSCVKIALLSASSPAISYLISNARWLMLKKSI